MKAEDRDSPQQDSEADAPRRSSAGKKLRAFGAPERSDTRHNSTSDWESESAAETGENREDRSTVNRSNSGEAEPPERPRNPWNFWKRYSGSGQLVPFFCVLVMAAAAWTLFFDNPAGASLTNIRTIVDGDIQSIEHVIDNGLHLGALIASCVLTSWLLVSPWWARPAEAGDNSKPEPASHLDYTPLRSRRSPDGLSRKWFWILVISAAVVGGTLRVPLLNHSFENDEEVAYRKFIHGRNIIDENGQVVKKHASWYRTWFYNVTGNNHVLQSVASRLTLDKFGDSSGSNHEALSRALPLAAGLLTIVAMSVVMWQSGTGFSAVLAAWLLAIHPWHQRYSVEARGYSLMLLFAVLAVIFLLPALQQKSWLTWLGFGLSQLACLLCFPAAIYPIAAINIGVLVHLARRHDIANLKKWLTVSIVGAAVFFQIMTPSFLRMIEWLDTPYETPRAINAAWFIDLWSEVAAGLPISDGHQARAFQLDFESWERVGGLRYWLLIAFLPITALAGCVYAVIRHPRLRWPVAGVLCGLLLTLAHLLTKPMVFHSWYLLALVLPFCIGLAMSADLAWRWKKSAGWIFSAVVLAAFGTVAASPLIRQQEYPHYPMRDAVERVRKEAPAVSPTQKETFTIAIGHGAGQFSTYDPWCQVARNEEQFLALADQAQQSGKRLFVYCIDENTVEQQFPTVAARLTNPQEFREMAFHYGVEAFWSITIYESTAKLGTIPE